MAADHNNISASCHDRYMQLALMEAQKSFDADEVPVGAVLVDANGDMVSASHNQTICRHDPSAHAEILCLRAAGEKMKNYRFLNTTLYVTVEPCVMCMGAIIHARIGQVVFGVNDPKWGGAGSLYHFENDNRFNHHPRLIRGVCENQCRQLMVDFFRIKRHKNFNHNND